MTCSREFLTEEQKSVVGGMAESLNPGLQLPSPREDTALEQLVLADSGQSHGQGLGHGLGEVTWRMMAFSERKIAAVVRGILSCSGCPWLGSGSIYTLLAWGTAQLAELVLLWKYQAPSWASSCGLSWGCVPWVNLMWLWHSPCFA